VVIVADFGSDVQTYCSQFPNLAFPKPKTCPNCAAADKLVGHGSYARHVCDHQQVLTIRVKRLFCTICRHTVSLLPSFCLSHRHYLTWVIEIVLSLRIQSNSSWNAIRQQFLPSELPVPSTCREWIAAFSRASVSYLSHMLKQLADWQLAPGKLELAIADISALRITPKQLLAPGKLELAIADISALRITPKQLLAAVPHLVAWLRDSGLELPPRTNSWLGTLWQWGHGARLGRLV